MVTILPGRILASRTSISLLITHPVLRTKVFLVPTPKRHTVCVFINIHEVVRRGGIECHVHRYGHVCSHLALRASDVRA